MTILRGCSRAGPASRDDDASRFGHLFRKIFGILPAPPEETADQRLDRARAWLSSESPKERVNGLSILGARAPAEALEPSFAALSDPDKHVRAMAFILLLGDDTPTKHGERIVTELGGELSASEWLVQMRCGAGSIGSFGLTQRLLSSFDEIARSGKRRGDRRIAARYAHDLRRHPAGWPLVSTSE